jgi:DNA repair exonuclease SbcCD ATPase subunit
MRKLKLRYVSGKNFKCFGPDGIELFFDDHGEVVIIKGINMDTTSNDFEYASNGSGKTSILDLICWIFYGKTVTKPKKLGHEDLINSLNPDGTMEGEIQVDDYRIIRSRNPDKIEIWQSKDHIWDRKSKVTRGAGVQKYIEENIVGLSHTAFCNILVFDDSDYYCFLELDAAGKRDVIENFLELDRYREHHKHAKDKLKEANTQVKECVKAYERLLDDISAAEKRIVAIQQKEVAWKDGKEQELSNLRLKLKKKQSELDSCDISQSLAAYEKAQARVTELQDRIPEMEAKKEKAIAVSKEAMTKLEEAKEGRNEIRQAIAGHNLGISQADAELKRIKESLVSLEKLEDGQTCPTCHGEINQKNYKNLLLHEQNRLQGLVANAKALKENRSFDQDRLGKKEEVVKKLETYLSDLNTKMTTINTSLDQWRREVAELLKVEKPQMGVHERLLEEQISETKRQILEAENNLQHSPYKEILESAISEKDEKTKESLEKADELKRAEEEVPYYEYWVQAFGDDGIRKYVVNGVIPALNAKIAYWMQYLIDSKIELRFNSQLEETIIRNGVKAYYHSMSKGEKRRINLAVSQAFAYIMMLNSGRCPSLVFLDEITGGGIDKAGITGIYNMIFELAKERQVFVTTHNQNLVDMLQGCDTITLVKKDDITKIAN